MGKRLEPRADRPSPAGGLDDATMRIGHEAIYQALFVQGRGALRCELTACLRTGRVLRMPRARTRARQDLHLSGDHDQPTSGGGSRSRRAGPLGRRPYPGSWEFGDRHLGGAHDALHSATIPYSARALEGSAIDSCDCVDRRLVGRGCVAGRWIGRRDRLRLDRRRPAEGRIIENREIFGNRTA